MDETGVVERDAETAGQRCQQPFSARVKGVRPVNVLERENASRAPAHTQRNEERRLAGVAAENGRVAITLQHLRRDLVEQQGFPCLHHMLAEADQRDRLLVETFPLLDHIRELEKPTALVVDRDAHDLSVKDLPQPVSDELVDRVRVELAGDRRLDAVDQCQLCVALPRLVDELSVLECDTQAARDRGEQSLIGITERVLTVEVLDRDHAGGPTTDNERLEDRRTAGGIADDRLRVVVLNERRVHVLEDCQRLACLHHVLAEADHWERHIWEVDAALDLVDEADDALGLVVDPDVDDLSVEDLLELAADDVVDRLLVEALPAIDS